MRGLGVSQPLGWQRRHGCPGLLGNGWHGPASCQGRHHNGFRGLSQYPLLQPPKAGGGIADPALHHTEVRETLAADTSYALLVCIWLVPSGRGTAELCYVASLCVVLHQGSLSALLTKSGADFCELLEQIFKWLILLLQVYLAP